MKHVHVVAYLHLKRALNDNVEFLAVVRVKLDGGILLFGEIGELYKEGLGELILEFRCEVVVLNAVLLKNLKALALSCDCEGCKGRASTFEKVNNFYTARLCALIINVKLKSVSPFSSCI